MPSYSRRTFIKRSSQAAGALGLVSLSPNILHAFSSDPVRLGVIGTGSRGNWLTEMATKQDNLSVVACCDVQPDRLAKGLSSADAAAKGYKDYRKVLERKDIDAVVIATPLSMHYEMAKDAIDAGKHVYCEKTMVHTAEEARKLKKLVENTDLVFQVGYQHRYSPIYQKIYELVSNGYLGNISHVFCQWNRNGDWRRKVDDPEKERMINWRMYREYSGGLMAELCSHQIDIVNWLVDMQPTRVQGVGGIDYWKDGRETYDNVMTIFEYPNGMKASFNSLTTNASLGYAIRIMGTDGTVVVEGVSGHQARLFVEPAPKRVDVDAESKPSLLALKKEGGLPLQAEGAATDDVVPTGNALRSFGEAIQNNTTPITNIKNGHDSAVCVYMANQAMQQGKIMEWGKEMKR